jgi:hypothetical protein
MSAKFPMFFFNAATAKKCASILDVYGSRPYTLRKDGMFFESAEDRAAAFRLIFNKDPAPGQFDL